MANSIRLKGLDLLRGVAVILVLFRHGSLNSILQKIGWIGVDLFFVLSGFLVTGLVLREYQLSGRFNFRNFFIRRGLKIYPAFYFFLVVSLLINYFEHGLSYELRFILAEIFFLQSYLPHVWTHTWSVAVEEHFYLGLSLIALWRIRTLNVISVKRLILYLLLGLLFILVMRYIVCFPKRHRDEFSFFSTHLRMDGILVGVICACLSHFFIAKGFFSSRILVLLALLFAWPPFVFNGGSYAMNTYGLTLMNIGFGFILLSMKDIKNFSRLGIFAYPLNLICFIGIHSYSIYLWHLLVLQELQKFQFEPVTSTIVYLVASVGIGVLLSYVVEKPFLIWREKITASKSE